MTVASRAEDKNELERLQKVMAAAGVGSRRACEELIRQGRVRVDGRPVTELGTKVDPQTAKITVNGRPVQRKKGYVYYKLHKPHGILSDFGGGARGFKTVIDLLPPGTRRVFPVGRLDLKSEGLMLLTDDGDLANKLTHPRYEHPKVYFVLLQRQPTQKELNRLRKGVELPDGTKTAPAQVEVIEQLPRELRLAKGQKAGHWLRVVLREGKKRQIRHMTAAIGHPTLRLVRWSIGSLELGDLPAGESRALTRAEMAGLRTLSQKSRPMDPDRPRKSRSGSRKNARRHGSRNRS